jgi:type IV secretory pathway VirB10-like protein
MKAVNKFQGYEHVKVTVEATPRGTGMSFTKLRNILKDPNATPEQQYAVWAGGFDEAKLGKDWILHLMDITRKGMGITQQPKQPAVQQPVAERLSNALIRPRLAETTRMSSAVKLQRAWEREQQKSAASAKRGREYMDQIKQDVAKKHDAEKNKEQGVPESGSPAQQAAIAISMKKAGKKPKSEAMLPKSAFAGTDKHKLGPAAHAKGKQKGPVKRGQFVGDMEEDKKKGVDGKACWKGYKYAGTKNGKDKCVPIGESVQNIMDVLINKIIFNEAISNNK